MGAQPANFFQSLAGIPVLYDRLRPEHYGKTGIPHKFHCTVQTQTVLEGMFQDLFARTVPAFGAAERILSAGAWVNKPGQHGNGKAFDLDAIHWERTRFIALEQPVNKSLYLAIQALSNKHCGMVLGYDYNAAHHDHLHIDTSRSVQFREANSVVSFIQQALNTFYGQTLSIDGEFGEETENALKDTLLSLGIPGVQTVDNWKRFLNAVCDEGISRVGAALDAERALDMSPSMHASAARAASTYASRGDAHVERVLPAMADVGADPSLPAADEPSVVAAGVLAMRANTGRIDLSYKPFETWSISSKTVGSKELWFADFDDVSQFYLGYRFTFENTYTGLARTGSASALQLPYDHESYRARYGDWASFIRPTGRCESEGQFLVVNSWDAAAMTFGFFQMAAHTGEHLAALFRELIDALPDEADKFFPEIKLGKQIGHGAPMQLFAVNGSDRLDLDKAVAPSDGLHSESYYRGHFMGFFNPHRGRLDPEEVAAAARWIAWMLKSEAARDICVRNAVNGAKKAVKRVHNFVAQQHHPKYPKGLDGIAMDLVAAAMDVKHHGRRNRDLGQSNDESIFGALIANDPMAAFAKIDTGWREDRSKRSIREIRAMQPWFGGKVYNFATETFQ